MNVIEWEELRDVLLVGHSYGGMVVTGAADRLAERLAALIYLDALVPQDGQCALDLQPPSDAQASSRRWPPTAAGCGRRARRRLWRARSAKAGLGGWQMHERLRLEDPPGSTVARKLYILCTDLPLAYMRQFYQWASAAPGWEATELATGHDAMITQPKISARLLELT